MRILERESEDIYDTSDEKINNGSSSYAKRTTNNTRHHAQNISRLTLLYPINTLTPAANASSFIRCNSSTVGAPGFSKKIVEHSAAMHCANNDGLSAVRPLINAHLFRLGGGSEETDAAKTVPYSDATSFDQDANSDPPGPEAPASPKKYGSTT